LRIAFSVTCGIACVLFVVLWVRSYYWRDILAIHHPAFGLANVTSHRGQLVFIGLSRTSRNAAFVRVGSRRSEEAIQRDPVGTFQRGLNAGFGIRLARTSALLAVPNWFIAMCTASLAAVPWLRWPKRFRLRTLLIAITLAAVGLGAVAMMLRSG
jgi:hypothetical protein